jgi:hypothetical protein
VTIPPHDAGVAGWVARALCWLEDLWRAIVIEDADEEDDAPGDE